ncbi:hypothetical protein PHYC_03393 [Phycisphaerales bacterium]|nr:hypothetical protein PHYC_03393 [Phycisphaerales bacterium]
MPNVIRTGAIAACIVAGITCATHAQVFDLELVHNGDAEAGPFSPDGIQPVVSIPGWDFFFGVNVVRYGTAGFPTAVTPGPVQRGLQFFAGGAGSPFSTASQVIDVSEGASRIDSGEATFDLSAWLGGAGNQDDNAQVAAVFNDGLGQSLGTATLVGPVASERQNTTSLHERRATGGVPVGTRSVTLALTMIGSMGAYNDGYADNISLIMHAPAPECDPDVNCDGAVNGFDVEATEQAVNGDFSNFCQPSADLNGDGAENGFDIETEEQRVNGAPCP